MVIINNIDRLQFIAQVNHSWPLIAGPVISPSMFGSCGNTLQFLQFQPRIMSIRIDRCSVSMTKAPRAVERKRTDGKKGRSSKIPLLHPPPPTKKKKTEGKTHIQKTANACCRHFTINAQTWMHHAATGAESQAAAYQVCLKFWLWISFNLLTRLNPYQAQMEKIEMTEFPPFLYLVGISNSMFNYTTVSGLSMAKQRFKTAQSTDFLFVCIKSKKPGLPVCFQVTSWPSVSLQAQNTSVCRMLCMHQKQEPSTSQSTKRQFHRFCHHNCVETP